MKPPFFIIGIGRSGTTLLRLMLHSHPSIAIPYESHFITDYYNKIDSYGDISQEENMKKLLSDILDEELLKKWDHEYSVEKLLERIEKPELSQVFSAIYEEYAEGKGKTRWGDKSDYLDRIYIINKLFPDCKFIHIIRDGRDVANSVMKLSWGPNDIIEASEWWHFNLTMGRSMGSMLDSSRYIEVRYEDLVENSEDELTRLCDFLDEKYSAEMLNYHKVADVAIPKDTKGLHYNTNSPPKTSRCYAWKREMDATDIDLFSKYAHKSLASVGYEIPEQKTKGIRLVIAQFMVFLKRALRR